MCVYIYSDYTGWSGIPTPLKNMKGIMVPNIWKNKNVPNHQPEKNQEN